MMTRSHGQNATQQRRCIIEATVGEDTIVKGIILMELSTLWPFVNGWIDCGLKDKRQERWGSAGGEIGRGESPRPNDDTSRIITTPVPTQPPSTPRAVPWEPIISSTLFTLWSFQICNHPLHTMHMSWTYILLKYVVMRVISATVVLFKK